MDLTLLCSVMGSAESVPRLPAIQSETAATGMMSLIAQENLCHVTLRLWSYVVTETFLIALATNGYTPAVVLQALVLVLIQTIHTAMRQVSNQ